MCLRMHHNPYSLPPLERVLRKQEAAQSIDSSPQSELAHWVLEIQIPNQLYIAYLYLFEW
jgi:hypothetical protein